MMTRNELVDWCISFAAEHAAEIEAGRGPRVRVHTRDKLGDDYAISGRVVQTDIDREHGHNVSSLVIRCDEKVATYSSGAVITSQMVQTVISAPTPGTGTVQADLVLVFDLDADARSSPHVGTITGIEHLSGTDTDAEDADTDMDAGVDRRGEAHE